MDIPATRYQEIEDLEKSAEIELRSRLVFYRLTWVLVNFILRFPWSILRNTGAIPSSPRTSPH